MYMSFNKDNLKEIKAEIKRLSDAVKDVEDRYNASPYYHQYGLSGVKETGNLKREYLSFKYKINKLINGN